MGGTRRLSTRQLRRMAENVFFESGDAIVEAALLRVRHRHLRDRLFNGDGLFLRPQARAASPPPPRDGRPLSPRETEVLRLLVQGKSTKEVAGLLKISFRTAACHRSSIMEKLNVHETASLVREAIRWRLVEI